LAEQGIETAALSKLQAIKSRAENSTQQNEARARMVPSSYLTDDE